MTADRAAACVRTLAERLRLRVTRDPEGFPLIPGRLGEIEWYCDGQDCHHCPLPGEPALVVYSDHPKVFQKLWALAGVRRWQTGDREMRAVFPPEALESVAGVIRARRRALRPMTPERLAALAAGRRQTLAAPPVGATSRSQDRVGASSPASGVGYGSREVEIPSIRVVPPEPRRPEPS